MDCPCSITEQYFTSDPEHQRLRLFHGFEIVPTHRTDWAMRGSSRSQHITEGPLSGDRTEKGKLLTVIQHEDGSPCTVGGRSEWNAENGMSGIVGSLQEWLNCGGVHIDSDPRTVLSDGERVVGLPSHLRTMGFAMQLSMEYTDRRHNVPDHEGVVCFLKVRIRPTWSVRKSTGMMRIGNESVVHTRVSTGVVVNLKVGGTFAFFELRKAVSAIAESMVLLQIPIIIVRFIALYCMGFISEMYRRAYRTSVNIYKEFHTTCARMMVMEVGFRGLLGGVWKGRVGHSHGLTIDNVFDHLCDIFHDAIDDGQLNGADLKRLVALMFADLDHDDTGSIACSEFINSCMMHDCVNVQDMVRFFATNHKGGVMARFLDDANKHSSRKMKKLNTSERLSGLAEGRRSSGRTMIQPHELPLEGLENSSGTDEFKADLQGESKEDEGDSEGTLTSRPLCIAAKGSPVLEGGVGTDAIQAPMSGRSVVAERVVSRPLTHSPPESMPPESCNTSLQTAPLLGPTDGCELQINEALAIKSRLVALESSQVELARRFEKLEIKDMEHRLSTWATWKDPDDKAQEHEGGNPGMGTDEIQLVRESSHDTVQAVQDKFAKITSAASNESVSPAQPALPRPSAPGQGMNAYLRELEALVTGLRGSSSSRQTTARDNGHVGGTSGSNEAPEPAIHAPTTTVQDQLELQALKAELLLTSTKTVDLCRKIHCVFRTMESRVIPLKDGTQCVDLNIGDSTCPGHRMAASSSGDGPCKFSASTAGHEGAPEPKLRGASQAKLSGGYLSRSSNLRQRLHEIDLH
eukprot:CAMPEP_0172661472 /NCGR_PEP_ID=MMETSP1074-20121228/4718_1 /TAXON_ID=2916 /ORGANISM="Ceratium fusus, Strain PA161109" /LENGTH=801 /DNA_ID=CAMNT_0013477241 /DNA_START=411 /DNA_END=2816 /DNA_ORIENTATION=-